MSKNITSQKLKYVCEGCGIEKEWELVDATPAVLKEMQEWYEIGRKVVFNGQLVTIVNQACGLACIPAASLKLVIPQTVDEGADSNIDLSSLQVGDKNLVN
jgi:hypothetical protein